MMITTFHVFQRELDSFSIQKQENHKQLVGPDTDRKPEKHVFLTGPAIENEKKLAKLAKKLAASQRCCKADIIPLKKAG